jgi:hypothetical protein
MTVAPPGRAMHPMPGTAAVALGLTLLAAASSSFGCPCQGSSGPVSGVTTEFEKFGASLAETARVAHGAWHPDGRYDAYSEGTRQTSIDLSLIAGYRPLPPLEASVEMAAGHRSFSTPYVADENTGFGDTTGRVRWDAFEQPMPYENVAFPWPSFTLVASLRMPTATKTQGSLGSGRTGSIGSSASSEGLGTWEPSLGAVVIREVHPKVHVIGYFEGAYRFPDTWLGVERHLAPRFLAQVGARYLPTALTAIGIFTDLGWEGDLAFGGKTQPDTGQRLWTVGAYGSLRTSFNGLRWGALVRWAPPADGIGKNATGSTTFGVSLGYAL